ncbi:MAG: reverse transcriptase family protein, partial [Bacteroidota bacterium]
HSSSPQVIDDPDYDDSDREDTDPIEPSNLERHLHLGTALATEEVDPIVDDGRDVGIPTSGSETYKDCISSPDLSSSQQQEIQALLCSFKEILTDVPGKTSSIEHVIELTTDIPVRHSYPLPHSLSGQLQSDLDIWMELGVVESSNSPYCSPLLAVRKKEGNYRICVDSRHINRITKFDAEPIADLQEIFFQLSSAKFLTKMDLSSGFWQVPLSDESKKFTAFSTRFGHYQFKVMPFGLVNAPATFSRLMRMVTKGLKDTYCYMDDILISSSTWLEHLESVEAILVRLKQHGLTVKPTKCMFGFQRLDYLGHLVGGGCYTPLGKQMQCHQRDASSQ